MKFPFPPFETSTSPHPMSLNLVGNLKWKPIFESLHLKIRIPLPLFLINEIRTSTTPVSGLVPPNICPFGWKSEFPPPFQLCLSVQFQFIMSDFDTFENTATEKDAPCHFCLCLRAYTTWCWMINLWNRLPVAWVVKLRPSVWWFGLNCHISCSILPARNGKRDLHDIKACRWWLWSW